MLSSAAVLPLFFPLVLKGHFCWRQKHSLPALSRRAARAPRSPRRHHEVRDLGTASVRNGLMRGGRCTRPDADGAGGARGWRCDAAVAIGGGWGPGGCCTMAGPSQRGWRAGREASACTDGAPRVLAPVAGRWTTRWRAVADSGGGRGWVGWPAMGWAPRAAPLAQARARI